MNTLLKIIITLALIISNDIAYSADISVYTNNTKIHTGDVFTVDILVNSQEELNAVEGVIKYEKETLILREISDGNSVVNFWIEKKSTRPGEVVFSGITASGFKGSNKKILSLIFEAKNTGETLLYLDNVKLLLNDGEGTDALESILNTPITIKQGQDNIQKELLHDTELPEYFNPEITNHSDIFDGKNFIIFSTQDKGSGISHYEIKEGLFSFYKKAESPYLLKNQNLNKNVYIKAVDLSNNERIVIITAQNPIPWYKHPITIALILFTLMIIIQIINKILCQKK